PMSGLILLVLGTEAIALVACVLILVIWHNTLDTNYRDYNISNSIITLFTCASLTTSPIPVIIAQYRRGIFTLAYYDLILMISIGLASSYLLSLLSGLYSYARSYDLFLSILSMTFSIVAIKLIVGKTIIDTVENKIKFKLYYFLVGIIPGSICYLILTVYFTG